MRELQIGEEGYEPKSFQEAFEHQTMLYEKLDKEFDNLSSTIKQIDNNKQRLERIL
jgi:hypothetical protein|tara:strand:- start:1499 stop:1666 length:168 start_codon:yes stop_codon:yes gene_type:complete